MRAMLEWQDTRTKNDQARTSGPFSLHRQTAATDHRLDAALKFGAAMSPLVIWRALLAPNSRSHRPLMRAL